MSTHLAEVFEMESWKFVHAADIHLDSPLRGLERYEGAPVEEIRGATREALKNLVELCLAEQVVLLVIAGDLYDGDWKDYNTGLFFVKNIARLTRAGIRVFIVRGNHDAASSTTKTLRLPDGAEVFSTREAETFTLENPPVAVHGRSYEKREVTDDISAGYPASVPDCFNLGVLHTALSGRAGHEPYAPCTPEGLAAKGYDYWALGHVHQREIVSEDPWIVFSGNVQGRHVRETGEKGATLVTVEDGRVMAQENRILDVVRWARVEVDVSGEPDAASVVESARDALAAELETADGRTLAARVNITGVTPAHGQLLGDPARWIGEVRGAANALAGDIWIEKVELKTRTAIDVALLSARDDAMGGLVRRIREIQENPTALQELLPELDDLRKKLPPEYLEPDAGLDFNRTETLAELVAEVEQTLLPRLSDEEDAP